MGCVLKEGCTQRTESFLKINTRGLLSDAACCQGEDAASDDALFWRVKRIPGPPVVMQKVGLQLLKKTIPTVLCVHQTKGRFTAQPM